MCVLLKLKVIKNYMGDFLIFKFLINPKPQGFLLWINERNTGTSTNTFCIAFCSTSCIFIDYTKL